MAKIGTNINLAKDILSQQGLVAIPTETVYGLAANALNSEAVLKIYKAKKRPGFDPLIVHSTVNKIKRYASEFYPQAEILAEKFWPGPLTLVLPKSSEIPFETTSGLDTVGLRVPNHKLTLQLLEELDFPLAAPSANPFGYISPTKAQHVNKQLGDDIDYILDGGDCNIGVESTIIGFENEEPILYRLGGISIEDIEATMGKIKVKINNSSDPKSPGMLKSHYAPKIPLQLLENTNIIEKIDSKTALIVFSKTLNSIPLEQQFVLSESGNYFEAAAKIYALLRELDQSNYEKIIAIKLPEIELGRTINDRLIRASA